MGFIERILNSASGIDLKLITDNLKAIVAKIGDLFTQSRQLSGGRPLSGIFDIPGKRLNLTKRDIYCQGELLRAVQVAKIFNESKTFVDKKLKFSISDTLSNFDNLAKSFGGRSPAHEALRVFVEENFEDGKEYEKWLAPDWKPAPAIFDRITDDKIKAWAQELNITWKNLGRRISDDVKMNPDLFSIIPVPHSFILPGGKSKEFYYWDSYWIVNGLLICEMKITAKDIIENLLYLVEQYGYVPLGNRVYYEGRSHPPMLIMCVESYFKYTLDLDFIKNNIQTLEKEIQFWRKNRTMALVKDGIEYEVFYYHVRTESPRPEAYREDIQSGMIANTAKELHDHLSAVKSASESGWSFSSRWFVVHGFNYGTKSNTKTQILVPVDLNAFMHRNYTLLKRWYKRFGNMEKYREYRVKAEELQKAIDMILWNERVGVWLDYDFVNQRARNYFYMSNLAPLWTKSYTRHPDELTEIILKYLNKYNVDRYQGGLPASTEYSGERWDFPNAWPPLQAFLIHGLDRLGTGTSTDLAYHFADKFISANYKGFQEHGNMFSAYDCLIPGRYGVGLESDEHETEGFGWTNGVVFLILDRWGHVLRVSEAEEELKKEKEATKHTTE